MLECDKKRLGVTRASHAHLDPVIPVCGNEFRFVVPDMGSALHTADHDR